MAKNTKHSSTDNITTVHFAYDLEKDQPKLSQHNRIVTILTFAMPSIAVVAVTLMLLWSELINQKDKFSIGLRESILGALTDTVSIVNPHYISIDDQNRPITFSAEFATETYPGSRIIELTKPRGSILLSSGSLVQMEANSGFFYREQNTATFTGNIRAFTDPLTIITTNSVDIDLKTKVLHSNTPVSGNFQGGTIISQGLITENNGDIIKFTGKAKLTLIPENKSSQTKNKFKTGKSGPQTKFKPNSKNQNKEN